MKRLIMGGIVGAAMLMVPLMGTAHADPNNYRGTVSPQGPAVGGARTIAVGAQCGSGAGSGAFAAFGPGNNFGGRGRRNPNGAEQQCRVWEPSGEPSVDPAAQGSSHVRAPSGALTPLLRRLRGP